MNTDNAPRRRPTLELFQVQTKRGPRAYRVDLRMGRSFPMAWAEAELAVATGRAVWLDANPFS